jgi:cell division protein FtsX
MVGRPRSPGPAGACGRANAGPGRGARRAAAHPTLAALRTFRLIGDVLFETRQEAYARFKEQYRDAPDLVESTKPEALPQSERLILADPADFNELKRRIEALPGVSHVVNSSAIGFPGADPIPPK